MSSKKITELTELETSEDDDLIAIVDDSASETKKQTKANFFKKASISIKVIDLSAQLDGAETNFDLGQKITNIIWVNLNGTILVDDVSFTLDADKEGITMTFAPDAGEELYVKVQI